MAKTSAVSPEQAKQIEAALRQRSAVAADAWKLTYNWRYESVTYCRLDTMMYKGSS